jgi:hypothetical protein
MILKRGGIPHQSQVFDVRKTNCRWTMIRASDSFRNVQLKVASPRPNYIVTDTSKLPYKIQRFRGTEKVAEIL